MNSISITGRLTENPELKTTPSGISVCSYRLAVKRPKSKDIADFLNVVSWRQGAEYIAKFGHKGDLVAVRGILTQRNWKDMVGKCRTSYEIVSDTVEILSSHEKQPGEDRVFTAEQYEQTQKDDIIYSDEELPF